VHTIGSAVVSTAFLSMTVTAGVIEAVRMSSTAMDKQCFHGEMQYPSSVVVVIDPNPTTVVISFEAISELRLW
jgi:hypothetical protein